MLYEPNHLIEKFTPFAYNVSRSSGYSNDPHVRDENLSIILEALVQCAHRWAYYCESKGYDPENTDYFWGYAYRRIIGALKDNYRSRDWLPRHQREKFRATNEVPPPYLMRVMYVDWDQGHSTAEDAPPIDRDISATEAQLKAYKAYLELSLGLQTALASRLEFSTWVQWGPKWTTRASRGKTSLLSIYAAAQLTKVVSASLGVDYTEPVWTLYELLRVEKASDWKPTDEFLDLIAMPVDEWVTKFAQSILDDISTLTRIIEVSHGNGRRQKP